MIDMQRIRVALESILLLQKRCPPLLNLLDDTFPNLFPEDLALLLSNLQVVFKFGFEAIDCGVVSRLRQAVSAKVSLTILIFWS